MNGKRKIIAGMIAFIAVLVMVIGLQLDLHLHTQRTVAMAIDQFVSPSDEETLPTPIPSPPIIPFHAQVRVSEISYERGLPLTQIHQAQQSFLQRRFDPHSRLIDVYQVKFTVPTDEMGSDVAEISARVFIPSGGKDLPLLVYGSGTTGIAEQCAPSLEDVSKRNIGNYFNQMATLASLGYVVVFPDYQGFGSPDSTHPYFVADVEARTMIGSIEAVDQLQQERLIVYKINFANIFTMGYSQGGHAALATSMHQEWLSEGKEIKGVIGYAPAFNVEALLIESPRLAPYLFYAYTKHYQLDANEVAQVFLQHYGERLEEDVLRHCIDTVYSYYPPAAEKLYQPQIWQALRSNQLAQYLPTFALALAENQAHLWQPTVPVYVIQGQRDPIVTAGTQYKNVQQLCQNQAQVTYQVLAGVDHYKAPSQGTLLAHNWIQRVIQGEQPNQCSTIIAE